MATGLRRGELLGLTWEHIDLNAGIIHVRQQWNLVDAEKKAWGLCPVKTQAGIRDVPIPPDVVGALVAHKETQRAEFGERWSEKTLVFDRGDGKPIPPEQLDAAWARVRKELKLPASIRLHDLRGTYITWLAEQGVNPKATAVLAGHADPKVTWAIYQRVTQTMVQEAARAVAGLTGHRTPVPSEQPQA